jgi:DNA-binding transcriptional ArsR family regulator
MEIHPEPDGLTLTLAALADPTRRAILARLAQGDADVSELMRPFDLSQPTISKHLKVLERAGLVALGRDAQRRPRTLIPAPLQRVDEWLESYRQFWEQRFTRLDHYLSTLPKKPKRPRSRDVKRGRR